MYDLPSFKIPAACGTAGLLDRSGKRFNVEDIVRAMSVMWERGNGLGAGFVAYGIYPEHADDYCLHLMCAGTAGLDRARDYINTVMTINHEEPIPTRTTPTMPTSGRCT